MTVGRIGCRNKNFAVIGVNKRRGSRLTVLKSFDLALERVLCRYLQVYVYREINVLANDGRGVVVFLYKLALLIVDRDPLAVGSAQIILKRRLAARGSD